jgi:hypothetical protein
MTDTNLARSLLSHRNSTRILLAATPMSSHLNPVIAAARLLVAQGAKCRPGLVCFQQKYWLAMHGSSHCRATSTSTLLTSTQHSLNVKRHAPGVVQPPLRPRTLFRRDHCRTICWLAVDTHNLYRRPDHGRYVVWRLLPILLSLNAALLPVPYMDAPITLSDMYLHAAEAPGALARRTWQYGGMNAAAHTSCRLKTAHQAARETAALTAHRDDPIRLKTPPPTPPNFRRASGGG